MNNKCRYKLFFGIINFFFFLSFLKTENSLLNLSDELYRSAMLYHHSGDYEKAISFLEKALKYSPQDKKIKIALSASYSQLGIQHFNNNEFMKAKTAFYKVIQYTPEDFRGYQNLALVLVKLNDYKTAKDIALKGLKLKDDVKELLMIAAECYYKEKNFEKSLIMYEKLYRYYPDDLESALRLGLLYRLNRRSQDAIKIYTELKKKYSHERRIYEAIAEIHSAGFRYSQARNEYEELLKFYPEDVEIKEKIANFYRLEKKYAEAINIYEELLKKSPQKINYYINIALIKEEAGDIQSAIETYEKAKETFPDSIILDRELGRLYELQNDFTKAEDVYKKYADIHNSDPYPWVRLGVIYEKLNNRSLSTECFKKAVDLNSSDPLPYYKLSIVEENKVESIMYTKLAIQKALDAIYQTRGNILLKMENSYQQLDVKELIKLKEEAKKIEQPKEILEASLTKLSILRNEQEFESDLKEFLSLYPKDEFLLERLALLYEKQNRYDEAKIILEKLLRSNVKSLNAHLALARIYTNMNRIDEAILSYKRILAIDDTYREAYVELIKLHKRVGKTSDLISEWENKQKISDNPILTEFLSKLKQESKEGE